MKICNISLLLLIIATSSAFSQNKPASSSFGQTGKIEESASLGRLEEGSVKLLSLKNGNTAFILFNKKKGFKIKLFDASHKPKSEKEIIPSFGKMGMYGTVESVFTIQDEIVILMSTVKNISAFKANTLLYRIIINGNTGAVTKDEQIGKLSPFGSGGEAAFRTGYLESPTFYVCKDPYSDNYAVAHFDSFESDRNKRLKLTHYGANHDVLNEGYFLSPNDEYKYISFEGMYVGGDSKLYVCASVYNTKEDKIRYLSLGCFDNASHTFNQKILEFSKNKEIERTRLIFNKNKNLLILLTLEMTGSENNSKFMRTSNTETFYSPTISVVNPATLTVEFRKDLISPSMNKEFGNSYIKKGEFNGVPQGFYVNDDNTYTVIYEELMQRISGNSTITFLGSLVISVLDEKFKEVSANLIPYNAFIYSSLGPLWSSNPNYSFPESLRAEDSYKFPCYLSKGTKKILLLNDVEEDFQKVKEGKITMLGSMGATTGYKYIIENGKQTVEQVLPAAGKVRLAGIFSENIYNPETETLTYIVRSNMQGWQNTIVWVKL